MLSKTEQVWRHLIVESLEFQRARHGSLSGLATELGMGISTVHRAVQRPAEMGAVQVRRRGGIRVVDPIRLLLLWAGNRNLRGDLLAEIPVALDAPEVERALLTDRFVLGGFGAVVAHEGGNFVSGYDRVLCYGDPGDLPRSVAGAQAGETLVTVLEADPLLSRYGVVTPLSQAYVDLFNVPGWAAGRFLSSLNARFLGTGAA